MKIAFFINTPAHVHLYKNIISVLKEKGHDIFVLARNYGDTIKLLDELGIEHFVYANVPTSKYGKIALLPFNVLKAYTFLKDKNPNLLVGMGVYSAYTSFLLNTDCVIFNDSEPTPFQFTFFKPFVKTIITPSSFKKDLGKKHIKVDSYKEFSYLHPHYLKPDKSIYELLGINQEEEYVLLRFNAFDAVHDIGINGFSVEQKKLLFNNLKNYSHVFISSELELPDELKEYSLKVPKYRIHDVLYYAKMVVADTQTITTEAAVLGTPVIRFNSFTGEKDMGNFLELENIYKLIFNFSNPDRAIEKATELIQNPHLKAEWSEKRSKLLADKIDLAEFMTWFLETYPKSFEEMKLDSGVQFRYSQDMILGEPS